MKNSAYVRFSITLLLLLSLMSPLAVLAGDGKKYFNQGIKHEVAEEWDKAVEMFSKAVTENPKNPEYRLHLVRSMFNASQMYMKKGNALAAQKDYAGAYIAFRQAYGYDPVNELAKSEMDRMVRLQQGLVNGDGGKTEEKTTNGEVFKQVSTNYNRQNLPPGVTVPQKLEKYRDVVLPNPTPLITIIRDLARDLDLNVLFDTESNLERRNLKIELKNVTPAKALDYIFLQENLFFQKVGPRTILVATGQQRMKFQQLNLRTFYLSNADPTEVAKVIQSAIPAQPGRTPTIPLVDKSTNSLTVRDTTENIKIIADLIKALDKDRAEVVMDVQIFEVSKDDLLRFGNQVGDSTSLVNLGGSTRGVISASDSRNVFQNGTTLIPQTFGVGLILPSINLVAFQSKGNTKLLASTQIHAFNNEDSSARIGQRVPVQTAAVIPFTSGGTNTSNNAFGNGYPVINYEQVGLTLKFKPIVFPNQDVQVTMDIESKDVLNASLTPSFTERSIKGTARIQNNKTLLLASVAQNTESNGRQGLPLLGLIPILGRLFTAPTKENRQVDIVIAVTPRVIRAPAILPEDEEERPTGSMQTPTSGSLEAMIFQEEVEEQLALARKLPTNVQVQLPDQKPVDAPVYVQSNPQTNSSAATTSENTSNETKVETQTVAAATQNQVVTNGMSSTVEKILKPIDASTKNILPIQPVVDTSNGEVKTLETSLKSNTEEPNKSNAAAPTAQLKILPTLSEMKAGEKTKIAVLVQSATAYRQAVLGLNFDPKKVAVRSVSFGEVFGSSLAQTAAKPFMNEGGKMFVTLASPTDTAENGSGVLAYVELEALVDGKPEIVFDSNVLNFLSVDGKNFTVKF